MKTGQGFGFLVLVASLLSGAEIEPDLQERLASADPKQKLPVTFLLGAQAKALELDPSIAALNRPERRARTGRVLMDFAAAHQAALLEWLRNQEAAGRVDGINPLWIVNAVTCAAEPAVIRAAAGRNDVQLIYYDLLPCQLEEIDLKPAPADGIQPQMIVTNVRGAWKQGAYGQNTVIGIVDTGVRYTHRDLAGHLWSSAAYPNCGFNFASYQYVTHRTRPGPSSYDTLTPLDYYGNGTYRAGIATADGTYGNGTHDTMGIAPAARIMSLPVDIYFYAPYPDTSSENSVLDAYQFCIRPPRDTLNGADVIYTGIGYLPQWQPRYAVWRAAQENLLAAGIVNFVTGGADGPSARTIRCPGNCPPPWPNPANHPTSTGTSAVITVGCTDNNDNLASFSSCGPSDWGNIPPYNDYVYPPGLTDPDVVMPGVNIFAPYWTDDQAYTTMSGTSGATAGAAAVACLMLSKNPSLTPREIDSILELYAVRDLGAPGKDNSYGAGRIDCSLAVAFTPSMPVSLREVSRSAELELNITPTPASAPMIIALTSPGPASVEVSTVSGRPVWHRMVPAGNNRLLWNGTDDGGRRVPAGCYLCVVKTGRQVLSRKILLTSQ